MRLAPTATSSAPGSSRLPLAAWQVDGLRGLQQSLRGLGEEAELLDPEQTRAWCAHRHTLEGCWTGAGGDGPLAHLTGMFAQTLTRDPLLVLNSQYEY